MTKNEAMPNNVPAQATQKMMDNAYLCLCLSLSHNPNSPQGVSMFGDCMEGELGWNAYLAHDRTVAVVKFKNSTPIDRCIWIRISEM